jgi:hypothetical protein
VRSGLTLRLVSKPPERANQFRAIAVTRDFHAAMTSSRM